MPLYILEPQPSIGEQIVGGLIAGACVGIACWAGRKAAQKDYVQQVETQTAAQERLMEVAHQQRLQEITYLQQIETQKQLTSQREKAIYTDLFCVIAIILITAGITALIVIKRNK